MNNSDKILAIKKAIEEKTGEICKVSPGGEDYTVFTVQNSKGEYILDGCIDDILFDLLPIQEPLEEQWIPVPHRCPVCNGNGLVPNGFYGMMADSTVSINGEQCKSCNGSGIIYTPQAPLK